ncbi:hypothetical protein ABRY74_23105 [Pseudomonas guariconensis]|uniref:hypothetical protein n=1 Tax=Pseudomonas guariconensis TaxID=1288410 RepID=UPI003EE26DE5
MKIALPDIATQQLIAFQEGTEAGIRQLQANLNAPRLAPPVVPADADNAHLLRKHEGWIAPNRELVKVYFKHFQANFPEYGTDGKLAKLLGLSGKAGDRRIREYKEGTAPVPYGVWREFLVITGRVPQDIIPVLAIVG